MRTITKQGSGGFYLRQAHQNPPSTSDQATSRWHSFGHKDQVMESLLAEQYHLCCYSEIRADEVGLGYHIEHVENKSKNPARTFDYTNLAASAVDSNHGLRQLKTPNKTAPEQVFGGHASGKRANIDLNLFISCHQPGCASFFAYLPSSGEIVPRENLSVADKDKAQYTIDTLNLNSGILVTYRLQWVEELQELLNEHLVKEWSVWHLAQCDLVPVDGKLSRFFSVTRQFWGPIAEMTLTQYAPELV